ncbi:MAG: class II aldolase/adducin family protein [Nocardioidaceae bacterium]|nr:class II aldolase/adducin family protein [Nocardioidaceae bacterium]
MTAHANAPALDLEDLPNGRVTLAEEREHRKKMLAVTLRLFARLGFDEGVAGHVTVRDPEFPERFWVNPYAVHFSRMKVSDLLLIDEAGKVVEGERRTNKAAFSIHSTIHEARPEVVAIAHTHSTYGRAWAAMGRELDPIIQESCAFYEDHVVFDKYNGLILDRAEGKQIAEQLGDRRAAILQHHGLLTTGKSVEEAAWWFMTMDKACHMQLLAEAAGTPKVMSSEQASLAHRQFSNPNMAKHSFNLLADILLEEEPDVLS